MRAVTVLCLLALAASASAFAQEDPCVAEVLKCRNEICKNREVLENSCESGEGSFMKACSCGGLLEQQQPEGKNSLERAIEASMGAQGQPAKQVRALGDEGASGEYRISGEAVHAREKKSLPSVPQTVSALSPLASRASWS